MGNEDAQLSSKNADNINLIKGGQFDRHSQTADFRRIQLQ